MFRVSIVLLSLSCISWIPLPIYALSSNNNFYVKNDLTHLLNFTTIGDGQFATTEPAYIYTITGTQASVSLTAPTVYYNIPDVTNPVLSIPPRTDANPNILTWKPNVAYKATFGSTSPPKFGLCIAGEGLLNTYTGTGDKFGLYVGICPKSGCGGFSSDKIPFAQYIQLDGNINGTPVWLTAPTACVSADTVCTLDLILYFTPAATTNAASARLYITSPDIQLDGSTNYTTSECPTNLLARIKAFQIGTPIIDSSSTGSQTNSNSTSTGETSPPTNSSINSNSSSPSSSSSNSTSSSGGGSSIFTNSSESSSPTSTPTPTTPATTPTPTPTPAPPAAPITTLNFNGNTILTISNAMKFKGGSNGALVSVWFKLLSSSLPPLNTPSTFFQAFGTTAASQTITQLGLILIRPRTTSYTVRLIAGAGVYDWAFVDLRHDEWEHIMAVHTDEYAYLVINNRRIESQKPVTGQTFGATPTTAVIGGSGITGQTISEPFLGLIHRIVITTDAHDLKVAMPTAAQVEAVASSLYNNGSPVDISVYNQVDDAKIMYVFANDTRFVKNSNSQIRFIDQLNSQDTTTEAVANTATLNFVQQSPGVAAPTTPSPTTSSPTTSSSSSSSGFSTGGLGLSSSPNKTDTTQSSSGAGSSSSSSSAGGSKPPNAAYQNTISVVAMAMITGVTIICLLF